METSQILPLTPYTQFKDFFSRVLNVARLGTLFLVLCNMPSYLLAYFGSTLGSLSSYLSSVLFLFCYLFTRKKHKLLIPFILLGLLYFTFSGLSFTGSAVTELEYLKAFARFMIVVVCGVEILYRTTKQEIYIILLIGALSIIINGIVFPTANANFYPTYGRYSGFYLNPNFAGSICLVGFALSYVMKQRWLKLSGQLLFTLGGLLTLSRTFVIIWVILNLIAIYNNRKNLIAPALGAVVLIIVLAFSTGLSLNAERFSALQSIFGSGPVQTETLQEDSRTHTWAMYTDLIMQKPMLGHGYDTFSSKKFGPGIHNSYLLTVGEAGIFPFLVFLGLYAHILFSSIRVFREYPEYLYLIAVLSIALLASHGFYEIFYNVLMAMFVYIHLRELRFMENHVAEERPIPGEL